MILLSVPADSRKVDGGELVLRLAFENGKCWLDVVGGTRTGNRSQDFWTYWCRDRGWVLRRLTGVHSPEAEYVDRAVGAKDLSDVIVRELRRRSGVADFMDVLAAVDEARVRPKVLVLEIMES